MKEDKEKRKNQHYTRFSQVMKTVLIIRITIFMFLLSLVPWRTSETFSTILDRYVEYLVRNFGNNIIVIFDGY